MLGLLNYNFHEKKNIPTAFFKLLELNRIKCKSNQEETPHL